MRITTIGRGSIGGTLARLWTAAGHQVTALGRDGGDAHGPRSRGSSTAFIRSASMVSPT